MFPIIDVLQESVAGVIVRPRLRQIWIAPDVPSRVAFSEIV